MSTSQVSQFEPTAVSVTPEPERFVVELSGGRAISVPYAWFPRLANANSAERADLEIAARGRSIHWPRIDEDLPVTGLLRAQ